MEITRSSTIVYAEILTKLAQLKIKDGYLAYSLAKDLFLLQDEVKAIQAGKKAAEDDFDIRRVALCEKFALKNEDGQPVVVDNKYQGLDNNQDFITAFADLNSEFIPKREEFNKFLEEKVEINFIKLNAKGLKDVEGVDVADLLKIMPIMED